MTISDIQLQLDGSSAQIIAATMLVASMVYPTAVVQESVTQEEWKGSFSEAKNIWTTILDIAVGVGMLAILYKVLYGAIKPHLPN